ncbi:hypothetical protein G9A89_016310 [Geosiphon pyriformis]|nr:hypothetical protein G9A89_016310 [Geosiphon pyriformis]
MSRKLRNGWTSDRTDWDNEIVVVTGGSRGIGGLLVETIALRNVSVIILDLAPPEVENGNVAYYKCDVSRFEEVERVAKQILIDVGHPTIVINNAGIIRGKTILDESHEEISKTIGVNLLSSFWTTKVFLPDMVKNNHGHIVTISSAIAYTGVSQAADYSASKAGLLGFHESLRFELHSRYNAKKVRTTLVCPGKVGTELFAGVEVSSPFFTPQLAPLDVVKAIITALDKNEGDDILIPYYVNLLPIIRFLPGFMIDLMRKFSGLDECMKTWWFLQNGGFISAKLSFKDYSSEFAGRGVVALKEIEKDEVLFTIPRCILLSPDTSSLNSLLSLETFSRLRKINPWFPLILCIMYESKKQDSLWVPYFNILQKEFDTPMFWSADELKELKGTSVIGKIGKEEAEAAFREHLLPIINDNLEIFDPSIYTIELFHQVGSLIMANAFHNDKKDLQFSVDELEEGAFEIDEEPMEEVTMIPMADMLNHRTGYNNARLFSRVESFQMVAIKNIARDEQIYNTYGELCSADLLRKYGYIEKDNIHDIVEINGQLAVDILSTDDVTKNTKIDMLLEDEILDDIFVLDTSGEIPPELIITAKVMILDKTELKALKRIGKMPKPTISSEIREPLIKLFQTRLLEYNSTIQEDEDILARKGTQRRFLNAVILRLSEKKILQRAIDKLQTWKNKRQEEKIAGEDTKRHRIK